MLDVPLEVAAAVDGDEAAATTAAAATVAIVASGLKGEKRCDVRRLRLKARRRANVA